MDSNFAVLISDTHIKSRLWTNFPGIQGDAYQALKIVAEEAKGIPVISCGDFFDSNRPSAKDLEAAADLIRSASVFLYVQGNHDDCVPSIVDSLDGRHVHLSSNPYRVGNTDIYGVDYQNTHDKVLEKLKEISEDIHIRESVATYQVIVMHQSLKEFFSMSTFKASDIFDIVGGKVKVFIGDIHLYGMVQHEEGGFIMSPGPLVPQDLSQANRSQKVYRVNLDNLNVSTIPLKVRDYYFLDATVDGFDIHKAYEEITDQEYLGVDTPLAKVVIIKAYPGFKVPKDILSDKYIFVTDNVRPKEERRKATVELTLTDAVNAEIRNTEGKLADTMIAISDKLLASETPDELALAILKKWKVVQNGT